MSKAQVTTRQTLWVGDSRSSHRNRRYGRNIAATPRERTDRPRMGNVHTCSDADTYGGAQKARRLPNALCVAMGKAATAQPVLRAVMADE